MVMDVKCSAVTSIQVVVTFDDGTKKDRLIAIGDIVDIEYNSNGLRKAIEGKVLKISAVGADPKAWYIIVDGSDQFGSAQAKFSPLQILDIEIIQKADHSTNITSPLGETNIGYLRTVDNVLQWSKDGYIWNSIVGTPVDDHHGSDDGEIEDPGEDKPKDHCDCDCGGKTSDGSGSQSSSGSDSGSGGQGTVVVIDKIDDGDIGDE